MKWFSQAKGYGFISRDEGGDLFCHQSAVQSGALRSLAEGQKVEFEVTDGPKGFNAANVRPITVLPGAIG